MKKARFIASLVCIIVSVCSLLLLPVLIYTEKKESGLYRIFDMLEGGRFTDEVLKKYNGDVLWDIDATIVTVFAIIFVAAFVISLIGLLKMRN